MGIILDFYTKLEAADTNIMKYKSKNKKVFTSAEKILKLCPDLNKINIYSNEIYLEDNDAIHVDKNIISKVIESDFYLLKKKCPDIYTVIIEYYGVESNTSSEKGEELVGAIEEAYLNEKKHIESIRTNTVKDIVDYLCEKHSPKKDELNKYYKFIIDCATSALKKESNSITKDILGLLVPRGKNLDEIAAKSIYYLAKYAVTHTIPFELIKIGKDRYNSDTAEFIAVMENNLAINFKDSYSTLLALAVQKKPLNNNRRVNGNSVALTILILIEIWKINDKSFLNSEEHISRVFSYLNQLNKINKYFPVPTYIYAQLLYNYCVAKIDNPNVYIKDIESAYPSQDDKFIKMIECAKQSSDYGISNGSCLYAEILSNEKLINTVSFKTQEEYLPKDRVLEIAQYYKMSAESYNKKGAYNLFLFHDEKTVIDNKNEYLRVAADLGEVPAILNIIDLYANNNCYELLCDYLLWGWHFANTEVEKIAFAKRVVDNYDSMINYVSNQNKRLFKELIPVLVIYLNYLTEQYFVFPEKRGDISPEKAKCEDVLNKLDCM